MQTNLERRIAELEKRIQSAGESPVWIDGRDNVVRVDVGWRRGETIEFPSVYDARLWIEKQIDAHAGGIIDYSVEHIADLVEDAAGLRSVIQDIILGTIVVPDLAPRLVDGEIVWEEKSGKANHPVTFDADHLWAHLALSGVQPGQKADLRLWLMGSLIASYFGSRHFEIHYKTGDFTDDDSRMLLALLVVYGWETNEPPGDLLDEFSRLFKQVTDLNMPDFATKDAL